MSSSASAASNAIASEFGSSQNRRLYNFFFTYNSAATVDPKERAALDSKMFTFLAESSALKGFVFQAEIGAQGNNFHLQGAVLFKGQTYFKSALAFFAKGGFEGIHLQEMKGSRPQVFAYCTKEETRCPGLEFHVSGDYSCHNYVRMFRIK